jgi:hypothetical protein
MSFFITYCFKAEISKITVMDFIAKTPPHYYFMIMAGSELYGIFQSADTVEFFTNEFSVQGLEIISIEKIKEISTIFSHTCWGNRDLMDIY